MLTFDVNYSMPRGYRRVRGVCGDLHLYPKNLGRDRKMKRRAGVLRKTCLRTPRSYIVGERKKIRMGDSGELLLEQESNDVANCGLIKNPVAETKLGALALLLCMVLPVNA